MLTYRTEVCVFSGDELYDFHTIESCPTGHVIVFYEQDDTLIYILLQVPECKKAEVPYFTESFGQYVLQKPPDELAGIQGKVFRDSLVSVILVAEGDLVVFVRQYPVIGNGHPVGVV